MQPEIDRKFTQIVNDLGYRPDVAGTLGDFLLAAPSRHGASESAVLYVLGKLWSEDAGRAPNAT